jgi:signal transduction histidine kinase/ABC-type nitrate/sulfonate/bicarbonate transport system substrate-binding protein
MLPAHRSLPWSRSRYSSGGSISSSLPVTYAALEKGFYAEEGLDVSLREFDPGTGRVTPVLEGKAQYGVGDSGLLKRRAEGKPVVVLAQIFQHSPQILLTRKESGIFSPYELNGKRMMLPVDDIGNVSIQAMLLETLGDINRVKVIPHSYNYDDLADGKTDAMTGYLSNEPFRLKKKGVAVNIIDPRSYGIDFYGDNLFTTESEINDHLERVRRMIRATLKGWAYALENKDEIISLIIKKYNPDLDQDQLRFEAKVVDQMILPDLIPIGDINPRRYERIAETYQRLGLSQSSTVPDGFIYRVKPQPADLLTAEERAWLEAHPDIELGYTDVFEPEVIVNPDGSYRGILVDFLDELNRRLGTRIRLRIDPIPEVLGKAQKRETDGILNVLPEYADKLGLLKTEGYLTGYAAVFAHRNVSFDRPSDLAGKKLAIIDGVFFSEQIVERYGDGATILKVKDALEGLERVEKGEADFFLGASINAYLIAKYQLFGLALQYVFYDHPLKGGMAIRSDWPMLVSILNKGISSFSKKEIEAIVAKWVHLLQQKDVIELTSEERDWLKQNHTVRVRFSEHPPYIFSNDGKPVGIAVDLHKLVFERTGIKFQYGMASPPFTVSLKGLIQHTGPDLISSLAVTPEREKKISFTKTYVSTPLFIFTRDDAEFVASTEQLFGKTVAVIENYRVHKLLAENYPDIKLLIFKSNKEALRAVSSGKAFAFIGGLISTPFMINEYGLKNLKASAPSALPDATVAMGIRNDWPELRDIINKVIDAIPAAEKAAIINKWSSDRIDYGIRPADILKWILVVAGAASGIVLLFVFWNRSLAKKVQERTFDLETGKKVLEDEIAERKKAEQKLYEYQHRLKSLTSQLTITEERERRRIAADLHDHIGQSLAFTRMRLAAARKATSKTKLTALLEEISETMLQATQDTMNLVSELSSPVMNEIGLAAAISDWLREQIGKRHGLKTECIDDGQKKPIDDDTRAILFRNVRELLTNVVKHAHASKVTVRLEQADAGLEVIVQDDGVGFDPHAASPGMKHKGGFGLFSIQERMADLGGSLEVVSEPGKGCTAVLTVPLGKGLE